MTQNRRRLQHDVRSAGSAFQTRTDAVGSRVEKLVANAQELLSSVA